MASKLADNAASVNTSLIRSKQVSPLPIGPGGNNSTKKQLNDTNTQLTMLIAQAGADTKYDPPVPKPVTKQVITTVTEAFSNNDFPSMLAVVGGLLIVYGIVAR